MIDHCNFCMARHDLCDCSKDIATLRQRVKVLEDALEDLKLCTTQGLRYPGTETLESLNSKCRKVLASSSPAQDNEQG